MAFARAEAASPREYGHITIRPSTGDRPSIPAQNRAREREDARAAEDMGREPGREERREGGVAGIQPARIGAEGGENAALAVRQEGPRPDPAPVHDDPDFYSQQEKIISFQHPDHETENWPAHGLKL